jgi:outer membrane protein assembly factor BamA
MRTLDVVGYVRLRPLRRVAVDGTIGWLGGPRLHPPGGVVQPATPATRTVFPGDTVFARGEQPDYVHGGVSITADTRDHRSHPTRGSVARAAWSAYGERGGGPFRFGRYEAEAAAFVPLQQARWVLAVRGWLVATRTADGDVVPFYLEPSLGGSTTLRSYPDYRFHGRHLLVANVEARAALVAHVDVAAFADAGNVAARLSDLDLAKTSYGIGVRMHTRRSNFARIDVAHGREGWRVSFTLGDPLHLSRLSRRTAAAPFVP